MFCNLYVENYFGNSSLTNTQVAMKSGYAASHSWITYLERSIADLTWCLQEGDAAELQSTYAYGLIGLSGPANTPGPIMGYCNAAFIKCYEQGRAPVSTCCGWWGLYWPRLGIVAGGVQQCFRARLIGMMCKVTSLVASSLVYIWSMVSRCPGYLRLWLVAGSGRLAYAFSVIIVALCAFGNCIGSANLSSLPAE